VLRTDNRDFAKLTKARQLEADCEEQIKKLVEGTSTLSFLTFAAEIAVALVAIRNERSVGQLASIYRAWRSEVRQVSGRIKYLNKQERAREFLKIILGDQVDNVEEMIKQEQREIERDGHRASTRTWVDLGEELNMERLTTGDYFVETTADHGRDFAIVTEDMDYIHLTIDGRSQQMSLRDYFERRIETLTPDLLKSKDTLDNILIVYIIKLAQGGNPKAFDFLYQCYEDRAVKRALSFIRVKAAKFNKDRFADGSALSDQGVKAAAQSILTILIKGDDPHAILQYLAKGAERPDPSMMLNRSLDRIVLRSYNVAIIALEAVISTLREGDKKFRAELKNVRHRARKAVSEQGQALYWDKMLRLGLNRLSVIDIQAWSATVGVRASVLVSYSPYFNKGTYKPRKTSTLTSWLFGGKGFRGVFVQKLNEWYRSQTSFEGGKRHPREEDVGLEEFREDRYSKDEETAED
jgi:hypothetical protein